MCSYNVLMFMVAGSGQAWASITVPSSQWLLTPEQAVVSGHQGCVLLSTIDQSAGCVLSACYERLHGCYRQKYIDKRKKTHFKPHVCLTWLIQSVGSIGDIFKVKLECAKQKIFPALNAEIPVMLSSHIQSHKSGHFRRREKSRSSSFPSVPY